MARRDRPRPARRARPRDGRDPPPIRGDAAIRASPRRPRIRRARAGRARDGRDPRDAGDAAARATGATDPPRAAMRERRGAPPRRCAAAQPAALFDELNWDYAIIERLNRDLCDAGHPVQPRRARCCRATTASNIALLPGDVVTVYSQKDIRGPGRRGRPAWSRSRAKSTRPGVYQLQPGETLK